ncbi:MAG: MFS transporter [Ruminococcaceae bacterium]|nr:MFS transporter [Oscillospiraceae bacterium]
MLNKKYGRVKFACYASNLTMSVVGNLSPLLFLTFRSQYGLSYSLLGLLVLINFSTQLSVDLLFSFFSHKFNIKRTVRLMPIFAIVGLLIFAFVPFFFPKSAFLGLAVGTVIFSASSGLGEVLISPLIAAIPSKNPDREMSKVHSIYAWGVVAVVIIATLFITIFGAENWHWLVMVCLIFPLSAAILFSSAEIPHMEVAQKVSGVLSFLKNKAVWTCILAIFLGGAAECTMAQWASGYLEQALGISKIYGDIFGVALFSATLGAGRSLYAKIGKNTSRALLMGGIGAAVCYLICAITPFAIAGLLACAFTGFCVSMLWPGSLLVASDRFPNGGVVIFALMASGGDLGASVAPQLVGIITDFALNNQATISLAASLSLAPEQLGMKLGMLVGALFPLLSIPIYFSFWKKDRKTKKAISDRKK